MSTAKATTIDLAALAAKLLPLAASRVSAKSLLVRARHAAHNAQAGKPSLVTGAFAPEARRAVKLLSQPGNRSLAEALLVRQPKAAPAKKAAKVAKVVVGTGKVPAPPTAASAAQVEYLGKLWLVSELKTAGWTVAQITASTVKRSRRIAA